MRFYYHPAIKNNFPGLATGLINATGLDKNVDVGLVVEDFFNMARKRLETGQEGGFPEIQAWRQTFSKMGLKPTQYRCASEALLRRFRKEDTLPSLHPLIDLCNAASIAFAIPVAVYDISGISGSLEVCPANGDEIYQTFGGDIEHPREDEIIFRDEDNQVHARRWCNRQSGISAVKQSTDDILIVCEAMHENAINDVSSLITALSAAIEAHWAIPTNITLPGKIGDQ
ncbi:MAG: hypothetical protein JKY49_12435 [Cohaesibacteraceae bacterium]|nr:hypothetical protein [Cohaesibacteraceae bacterium]